MIAKSVCEFPKKSCVPALTRIEGDFRSRISAEDSQKVAWVLNVFFSSKTTEEA